eukprot:9472390-Pyramimonas_sp.AAC.1
MEVASLSHAPVFTADAGSDKSQWLRWLSRVCQDRVAHAQAARLARRPSLSQPARGGHHVDVTRSAWRATGGVFDTDNDLYRRHRQGHARDVQSETAHPFSDLTPSRNGRGK